MARPVQEFFSIGEVCARSNVVLKGYWEQPEETARAIYDGYFHSGDLAVWDEFGSIHIVDRKKDIIISGGENISTIEVERCIYQHSAVLEVAVIAIPEVQPGLSGPEEAAAFRSLPAPEEREVERVAHLVLMQLLPALADGDLIAFGAALTEIQRVTGGWFAPAQGGAFASGATQELVERMAAFGAAGVGQSSWGPTVYGLVPHRDAGRDLAQRVRASLGGRGRVFETPFAERGALVHSTWAQVGRD